MKKHIFSSGNLPFLFIVAAILYTFWNLPKTFYQQDEWLGLGQIIALGFGSVTHGFSLLQFFFADSRPLTRVLGVIFFGTFPLNPIPLAYYGIAFHIVNSFLVFLLIKRFFKSNIAAFLGTMFFALSSVSHQSITWFAASFGVQPASTCILLSIYLFLLFLEKNKKQFAYISLFFALLSLYFKESGIFLFIFFPLLPFIFGKKIEKKKYIQLFSPFLAFIFLFILYRLFEMIILQFGSAHLLNAPVYASLGQGKVFFVMTMLSRIVIYPLTSFSLLFVPVYTALAIALEFTRVYYPYITQRIDLISETIVLDLLSIVGSVLLVAYIIIKTNVDRKSKPTLYFILSLFFLSVMPYIVVGKTFAYMEPRYYYIPLVAGAVFIGYLSRDIFTLGKKFFLLKAGFLIGFAALMFLHVGEIRQDIQMQVVIAKERTGFMKQLLREMPTLTANTNVFYFTSDRTWWDDNNTVPFQHGFGYSVPVLYYNSGKMPKTLLVNGYLWALGSEGYEKIDGLAYGYYTSLPHLKSAMQKYHFSPKDVHAFSYNSQTKVLTDVSQMTQEKLEDMSTAP